MKKILKPYYIIILLTLVQCEVKIEDRFITTSENLTMLERLEGEENYSMFLDAVRSAGFANAFNALNPYGNNYTLFLPNNAAFGNFIAAREEFNSFDDLLEATEYLRELLRFHTVNTQYKTFDFSLGALGDTTLNGELLLIGFNTDPDAGEAEYFVNGEARILTPNIICSNGYIHEINAVMTPVVNSSYEQLKMMDGFNLFTEGLERTGLYELMTIYKNLPNGNTVRNYFTLLAEPDTVYGRRGINTLEDLADFLGTGYDFTDSLNGVNNYFRYHILEDAYFLSGFSSGLYPTFGISPVSISVGDEIRINAGSRVYDTLYLGSDTIAKDWIDINFGQSNTATKNGAIHVITEPMSVYFPAPQNINMNFSEEPGFASIRNTEGYHSYTDPEELVNWNWQGANALQYVYLDDSPYNGKNAIQLYGFFTLEYRTPKVLTGQYDIYTRNDGYSASNAMVQFYIDGNRIGTPIDLTVGGNSATNPMAYVYLGYVSFDDYRSHTIRVEAISGGRFIWDYIQFKPVTK